MNPKTHLTDLVIRSLKPPAEGVAEYTDGKVPGLRIRISKNGTKTFHYAYRYREESQRFTFGRYPQMGLADARAKASEANVLLKRGVDPANVMVDPTADDPLDDPNHTVAVPNFGPALEDYAIHLKATVSPKTAHEKARNLRALFNPELAAVPLDVITTAKINAMVVAIRDRGSPSAANHGLSDVKGFFAWAVAMKFVKTNVAQSIPKPATVGKRKRFLKPDEIRAIWLATKAEPNPIAELTQIALLTAQRRTEVAEMRWNELDFERGFWAIPGARTKNRRDHVVPLSSLTVKVLQGIYRVALPIEPGEDTYKLSPFVFPAPKDPTRPISSFSHPKARIAEIAKVDDWCIHDLRRTFTTALGDWRISQKVKKKILNHSENEVTDIYDRFEYFEERCEAMQLWADYVQKAVAGTVKATTSAFVNPYLNAPVQTDI